jgi:hypothetical protein
MSGVGHPGGDPETPLTAGPERAVAVREIPAGGERKYGRRICPVCGDEFTAASSNARFCPPTERDRERAENS